MYVKGEPFIASHILLCIVHATLSVLENASLTTYTLRAPFEHTLPQMVRPTYFLAFCTSI